MFPVGWKPGLRPFCTRSPTRHSASTPAITPRSAAMTVLRCISGRDWIIESVAFEPSYFAHIAEVASALVLASVLVLASGSALALIVFTLSEGPRSGWTSSLVITCGTLGVLAAIAMTIVELRIPFPMLDLNLLRVFDTVLRDRSVKAKSRFSKERDDERALKERQNCLVALKRDLEIPAEVLAALPSPEEILAKAHSR